MAEKSNKMSIFSIRHFYGQALPVPDVEITQYGYVGKMSFWTYQNCSSPFWYLWLNETRGAYLEFAGKRIELRNDFFVLIPPFTQFSTCDEKEDLSQFYIHFRGGSILPHVKREPIILPFAKIIDKAAESFFNEMLSADTSAGIFSVKLYSIVYRVIESIPPEAILSPGEWQIDERVRQALNYISGNLRRKRLYDEFCRNNHISVNNLIRLFKKNIGMTPQQYRLIQRIEEAKNLLSISNKSIDEIADATGFADRYHFSKTFKRITHLTPVAFRNAFRKQV
jgi:AraC-like DNA-binding protein